jgi:hypothetical protein
MAKAVYSEDYISTSRRKLEPSLFIFRTTKEEIMNLMEIANKSGDG